MIWIAPKRVSNSLSILGRGVDGNSNCNVDITVMHSMRSRLRAQSRRYASRSEKLSQEGEASIDSLIDILHSATKEPQVCYIRH
jgi:hypothetical protein